jgi:hypothetical protein
MLDLPINDPVWFRNHASKCRDLARNTESEETKQSLLFLAEQYEADAENIERESPAPLTTACMERSRKSTTALEPIDDEYEDFIARVLTAAAHAQLLHIPGHGERLPKG